MAKQDMGMDLDEDNGGTVYPITPDKQYTSTPDYSDYKESFASKNIPLIIDNGSWQCRAGWASEDRPRLIFDNQIAKFRDRRGNIPTTYVGNDVYSDMQARNNVKSAFDQDIMCNPEIMVTISCYDYMRKH
ncbi:Nuclear actin-protein involved in chromatin remodeling [Modicella reniformis]|uniref:Nuclear actin-protein involved in chromatin remodeling n=1 Tax=Modicella reniformis TaxID=1440133 RepID=A0A9P6STX8_9FUNG|nr:Nuclear actin-protein involved in chromatin remodeling [Modicella reniformis]